MHALAQHSRRGRARLEAGPLGHIPEMVLAYGGASPKYAMPEPGIPAAQPENLPANAATPAFGERATKRRQRQLLEDSLRAKSAQVMDGAALRQLIRQGEGSEVEFKKTVTHLYKIARTITALANNRGGRILIGVQDSGAIIGTNPDEESFMVLQAARDWCRPVVPLELYEHEEDGLTVLIVQVPESAHKPHQARNAANEWHTYVRSADRCLIVDKAMERQLSRQPEAAERDQKRAAFGHNEEAVFGYLKQSRKINPKDLARLVNISRQRAEKILINLVLEGHLMAYQEGPLLWYVAA